jgi:hypothetical protein
MLGGYTLAGPAPLGHTDHHRHFALPARHQAQLGRLVADKHDLGHRAHANQSGSGGGSGDGVLGNGGVSNPLRSELVEQGSGHAKGTTVYPDVLAQQEHTLITQHLLPQRFPDRLLIGQVLGRCAVRHLHDQIGRHSNRDCPQGGCIYIFSCHHILLYAPRYA